jgi:hypothetical protein
MVEFICEAVERELKRRASCEAEMRPVPTLPGAEIRHHELIGRDRPAADRLEAAGEMGKMDPAGAAFLIGARARIRTSQSRRKRKLNWIMPPSLVLRRDVPLAKA